MYPLSCGQPLALFFRAVPGPVYVIFDLALLGSLDMYISPFDLTLLGSFDMHISCIQLKSRGFLRRVRRWECDNPLILFNDVSFVARGNGGRGISGELWVFTRDAFS
jgi:hypothetical protein